MNYLHSILELIVLLFFCLMVGRHVTRLLPKNIPTGVNFFLTPVVGLASIILLTTLYGWFFPFKFYYSLSMVIIIAGITFIFEQQKKELIINGLQLSLFAVICTLPLFAQIIFYGGYNPFTDTFTYLVHGQWLQSHPFLEKANGSGHYPWLSQIIIYQSAGSRMGGSFFLGFAQSLFNLEWSYYAYPFTIALAFVVGSLAIGAIIKQTIPTKNLVVFALCLLPSFSMNGFVFGAQWGFFPQTFGLALAVGAVALLPLLITSSFENSPTVPRLFLQVIPLAICTAAFLFAYNDPFVIFGASIFLFLIITVITFKNKIKPLVLFLITYLLEILLLVNYEIIRIVRNFIQTLSITKEHAAIGWPVLWSPVQFFAHAFGMKSAFKDGLFRIDGFMGTYFFTAFFIVMCFGIYYFVYKKQKNHLMLFLLICIDFVFLMVFLKFRYLSPNMSSAEVGFTFLQYKIAKYASPFSLALIGIFFAALWVNLKKLRPFFTLAYLIAIVVGLALQCMILAPHSANVFLTEVQQPKNPFNVLLQLRSAVSAIPKEDVIYLNFGEDHTKLRQMVAYILYDHPVASDYRDDGYILGSLPIQDRNMPLSAAKWVIEMKPITIHDMPRNQITSGPFMIRKLHN